MGKGCIAIIDWYLGLKRKGIRSEEIFSRRERGVGSRKAEYLEFLLLTLRLTDRIGSDLLVILLEGGQILTGLGELTFLHTFTNVPVNESALGVHQIKLVIETGPSFGDSGSIGQHADGAGYLGNVTARDGGGWLVINADLEASGAPVDELNSALGTDGRDGGVGVLRNHITTVEQAAGHVLAMTGVALDHLILGLEAGGCDLGHVEGLVVRLGGGNDGGIGDKREVNARVGDQIGLELVQIDVEGTIEAEGGGDGRDNLSNQPVEIVVARTFNAQVTIADVIDGLVIDHEGTIRVFQRGVGGQDGVVGLNDGSGNLRGRVDRKLKLGFLSIVNRETLEKKGTEAGAGTTTKGVENQEALETSAAISNLTDAVKDSVDQLLADSIVTTGVVVGGVLLAGDQLLRMEQLTVGAGTDLVNDGGFEIDHDGTGHVLAGASLGEKGVKAAILRVLAIGIRGESAIGLKT